MRMGQLLSCFCVLVVVVEEAQTVVDMLLALGRQGCSPEC
jgi:hypothetical protein